MFPEPQSLPKKILCIGNKNENERKLKCSFESGIVTSILPTSYAKFAYCGKSFD